jgi:single-strand DNA-binding protein
MINQAMLIGNLGANPEQRKASNGSAVTNFSLATSSRWKDADGQMKEETEWHRIVTFGRLAEICGQYLTKGSKVYIEGRLQTNKWTNPDGNIKYTTQVVAKEMKMLDSRSANNNETGIVSDTSSSNNTNLPPDPFMGEVPFKDQF